jgi:flagellar basal body-associated protein FliL
MSTDTQAAPPKGKGKGLIILVLLVVFALGAGASAPWIIGATYPDAHAKGHKERAKQKQVALPFDNVVVNLGDERVNRFLRAKLLVAVYESDEREVTEVLAKQKAFLKSWLIEYLYDQSFQDMNRKVGVNRIRREIREQFNVMLYPNGEEKITDILFDEFQVQ